MTEKTSQKFYQYVIVFALAAATIIIYWQVRTHEFVIYDDDEYITENSQLQQGISVENIRWAFTTGYASNWHPLTWISHMLDYQLYGLNPAGHHLTNLFFHALNTVFLFLVLQRLIGALWQSAFVAAIFALHPLHVESVAWASERKDVLSAFFWILTTGFYIRYVENQTTSRYLLVLISFTLGLLSKPMLVTLPFVFLLLDYWPLQRLEINRLSRQADPASPGQSIPDPEKMTFMKLAKEKLPLFLLAGISSVVTFLVQQHGGAVASMAVSPFHDRIPNALIAYLKYIGKAFWPSDLAVMYPIAEGGISGWQAVLAGILIIAISYFVIRKGKSFPYLPVGWFWYLGTLVPVIGIVQVGAQSMADRYMYLPLIGLSIMVAWGISDLLSTWKSKRIILGIASAIIIILSSLGCWIQLRHWQNSVTLFEHALLVTENNSILHNNLGIVLARNGETEKAITHFSEALRINPDYEAARRNLKNAQDKSKISDQTNRYAKELNADPNSADAHFNMGNLLASQGKNDEAITHYLEALHTKPDFAQVHNNIASVYAREGKMSDAITHYEAAVKIKPDLWNAHYNLGLALAEQGKIDEAIEHYSQALRIKPDDAQIRLTLQQALHLRQRNRNK